MLRIDNAIKNLKVIRTPELQLSFDVIKEHMYKSPMNLMLPWWDRNCFYNTYYISKNKKI